MTFTPKPRKELLKLGRRGQQVRVFVERGHELVRVQWTARGQVEGTRSYPNTPTNRAAAKAFAEELDRARRDGTAPQRAPLTLRDLWERYAVDQFPHLRPNSQRLYGEGWAKWETFAGRGFLVESTTLEMVAQFRRALERQGLAVNTIRQALRTAKMVYRWGERQELIQRNRLALYQFKVAKDKRPESPAEFRRDDFALLLAQFDPAKGGQWRPYVALALCGYQGARSHAVLHLAWDDVDFEAGVVTWRAAWDKLGREWQQPLRAGARKALAVAAARRADGLPWVIPSPKAGAATRWRDAREVRPYTQQALLAALKGAEKRAGIAHAKGRGAHGLRRMLSGDINDLTGDPLLALHAIGDTDIRQAQRYLKKRNEKLTSAFAALDAVDESASIPQRSRNANGAAVEAAPLTPENEG